MEALALKYRPRTFEDLVGQPAVQVLLREMVAKNEVPSALLFEGCRGTGKTTSARILAAALNCDTPPGPCGHCPSCKSTFDGTSLDVIEIDAASNGLVDDIRQLRTQILYSVGGRYRVVLLDEAHSMSTAAFNALLKTLEEPPPATVFVLLTTERRKIPDTILSRCMPFTFRRIGVTDTIQRLQFICQQENRDAETSLLTKIAERADGGLRDAIMTLDQVTRVGIATLEQFNDLMGESDYAPTLLAAAATGNLAKTFEIVSEQMSRTGDANAVSAALVELLRDVLILQSGGDIPKQDTALAVRRTLAAKLDTTKVVAALRLLWDLKTKVRAGDDPRSNLDLSIVMISELFPSRPAAAEPNRKLTLGEMG